MAEWWQDLFGTGSYRLLEHIPADKTGEQVDFVTTALELERGMRVLDIACGVGRHTIPFAACGLDVVGLDYSPVYLRKGADDAGLFAADFVRGDMRALPLRDASFDAAVCLFTSFGYFATDQEHARTIAEAARVLKPGGRFFLDVMSHDGLIRKFQERDWTPTPDGGLLLETRRWDGRRGRVETVWTLVGKAGAKPYDVSIRLYTMPEVEHMLIDAGMRLLDVWGDWQGQPLAMESPRLLVLAERIDPNKEC